MQRANHWFVAVEQSGELRVSGWNPRGRSRGGAKHLCGQTCLYKLVDEFIAHTVSARGASGETPVRTTGASSSGVKARNKSATKPVSPVVVAMPEIQPAYVDEYESSARLIPSPKQAGNPNAPAALQDAVAVAARDWRAEAWKREREREQNQGEHRARPLSRRRTFA